MTDLAVTTGSRKGFTITGAPRFKPSTCAFCARTYQPVRYDQRCCTKACTNGLTNLEMTRARKAYAALYNWRKTRGADGKGQFAIVCQEVDRWVQEDRQLGRKAPPMKE